MSVACGMVVQGAMFARAPVLALWAECAWLAIQTLLYDAEGLVLTFVTRQMFRPLSELAAVAGRFVLLVCCLALGVVLFALSDWWPVTRRGYGEEFGQKLNSQSPSSYRDLRLEYSLAQILR